MRFVGEKDCRLTLGYAFDERFVYEFELKNKTRRISKYDFVMPNSRLPNKGVEFDHFRFVFKNAPKQYKTEIEPPRNKVGYDFENISQKIDLLVLNKEKEIRKCILIQQNG